MNDKLQKRKPQPLDLGIYGKVPPQNTDMEKAVLGAIMLERRAFDIVVEILQPECFYMEAHQIIYGCMMNLSKKGLPIDELTLCEELLIIEQLDKIGGPYFLTTLTRSIVSAANIETHARIVLQKHMLRHIIQVGGTMVQSAFSDGTDVFDLIDESERLLSKVNESVKSNYSRLSDGMTKVIKKIEDLRHSDEELTGVTTGFKDMDKLTCGWQAPDLIVLAARPSVGKTALALNLALAAVRSGKGAGFFSMEMSEAQLIQRLLSMESEIYLEKIVRGKLSDDEMKDLYKLGVQPLVPHNFYIDDTPALNIYELRSKARRMVKQGVGIIFIDYLQLMSGIQNGRADNREQEISKISRDLKGLAKELHIPVIALSQLSRAVESRAGEKMPILSDLRESGAIEQDADIVMFMYRPEYYGKSADENGNNLNGETCIKFAKHRSGALDIVKLRAELAIQKFHDHIAQPTQLGLTPLSGIDFSKARKTDNMANYGVSDEDAPF